MNGDAFLDSGFTSSPLGAVYSALIASLDGWSGNVAPGASAIFMRAADQLAKAGDRNRVACLQQIHVTILRLQQAAAAGAVEEQGQARQELRRFARLWLEQSPMFPASTEARPRLAA